MIVTILLLLIIKIKICAGINKPNIRKNGYTGANQNHHIRCCSKYRETAEGNKVDHNCHQSSSANSCRP